jgi:hypothetical protein
VTINGISPADLASRQGGRRVAKDKKKKKKDKPGVAGKTAKRLKAMTQNPLAADIVAAALVATAAALKDSNKARRLAGQAGDQLAELAKEGADRGNAMWQLALDVGRRALEELSGKDAPKDTRKTVKRATKAVRKTVAKGAAKTVRKTVAKAVGKGRGTRSSSPKK